MSKKKKATSKKKAKVLRLSSTTPTLAYSLESAGVSQESVLLSESVLPQLSLGMERILMAFALCGNNNPHKQAARMVGAFHKVATPKSCAKCRKAKKKHTGPCSGNDGWTRFVISHVGNKLKTNGAHHEQGQGSTADRVVCLYSFRFMKMKPEERKAKWLSLGSFNMDA